VRLELEGARHNPGQLILGVVGALTGDLDTGRGRVQKRAGLVDPDSDLGCVAFSDNDTGNRICQGFDRAELCLFRVGLDRLAEDSVVDRVGLER